MGGSFYVKPEALSGGPLEEGAKVQYQGQTVTILQEEDEDSDIEITNIGILALANALRVSPSMTFVDVSGNSIGDEGMRTIGAALLRSTTSKLGAIKCDAFDLPVSAISLDLYGKRIGSAAGTLLAGVIKGNASVTSVRAFENSWSCGG